MIIDKKQITPFFLTVDTEGDNIWERPKTITAKNVESLYTFQELCNRYKIKPIYLVNYEALINSIFKEFCDHHLKLKNIEIGMHIHAWNSPPLISLTSDDNFYQPYLHEYPEKIISSKIDYMVKFLEDSFNIKILSHRGGRYSVNEFMLSELIKHGIKVDCSYTPGISWQRSLGHPQKKGGPDFRKVNRNIHFIKTKEGMINEIPVSTFIRNNLINKLSNKNMMKRVMQKLFGESVLTLRPYLNNFKELKTVTDWNVLNTTHLQLIIHSSELSKGFSSLIKNDNEEKIFYDNLTNFFIYINSLCIKSFTFSDYLSVLKDSEISNYN